MLLEVKNISKHFDVSGGFLEKLAFKNGKFVLNKTLVRAVNDVSFDIQRGETFSVVGESGCGKSTLGRCIVRLYNINSGNIYFDKNRIDNLNDKEMLKYRKRMQMVFQDPYASLNPRKSIKDILTAPLKLHYPDLNDSEIEDRAADTLKLVGGDTAWFQRLPHEFSGGQRQRISIARALVVDPEFIVADEPISALDVSIQAQIINLLMDAQEKKGLTYLFIAHDLSVVEHISNKVLVMYLGRICELSDTETLFSDPLHPYTKVLFSAIPRLGKPINAHITLSKSEVPTPINLPSGCVFHGRCKYSNDRCKKEIPKLVPMKNRLIACHGVEEGRI